MGIDAPAIAQWLTQNPWGVICVIVIGIVGTVATVISLPLAIRGVRVRCPRYSVRGSNLIRDAENLYPDLEISYRGYSETVVNLTAAKVMFFNKGREAIRKADVAKTEPLVIRVRQGTIILGLNVLSSVSQNQFTVTRTADRTCAVINFEFMDHRDGAVIQIMHTGTEESDVTVEGLVINGGRPKRQGWGSRAGCSITIIHVIVFTVAGMYASAFLMGRFDSRPLAVIDWVILPAIVIWVLFRMLDIVFLRQPLPYGKYKWAKPFYRT